jgi:hypothetical protein
MNGLYLVRLDPQATAQAVDKRPVPHVCMACAAGYHEQILLAPERCACPCHGTRTPCLDYEVAA